MAGDNALDNLKLEYDENISYSYHKIKKEYRKKVINLLTYSSVLLITVIVYFTLIYQLYRIPGEMFTLAIFTPIRFNLTLNWTVFSFSVFTIIYLIKIVIMRITPSLKEQIRYDINVLGFNLQEKRFSWIIFLSLNSISILFLVLIEFNIINFNNTFLNSFFNGLFIVYLFISLLIPVLWRFSHDGLFIILKGKYRVSINPFYKISKINPKDSQLIGISLTSNKIVNKFSKNKKNLYLQIVESRWLPRKRKSIVSKYSFSPFLRFYEFSTPLNFQKQVLNIVLALQDWDMLKEKN